jgi:trans-aconitate methyltransferase
MRKMAETWSPSGYARHAGFVPALGAPLVDRLKPVPGERILDLGCGDGSLTLRLEEAGADVIGVDASPSMVAAALARGLDARVMDAAQLTFRDEFDAVFSNAALHWMLDPDAVLGGVVRALKPKGRFVAEFGGHTNVAAIAVAIRAVLARRHQPFTWPWYFPTAEEYAARAAASGLAVEFITTFPRPTPLPTDMSGWLRTFAHPLMSSMPEAERAAAEAEIIALLAPSLRDGDGRWTADYVRLQIVARRA